MTNFDKFVFQAVEQKLPQMTLALATSVSYYLTVLDLVRLVKDSLAWGMPDEESYPVWQRRS